MQYRIPLTPLPKILMLAIAVAQGLLFFALYRAFEAQSWPSQSPIFAFPLWSLSIFMPVFLLLSLNEGNETKVLAQSGIFALVLTGLAAYTGWQAEPYGKFPLQNLSLIYGLSMSIACFKALMYLQQRVSGEQMTYQVLFTFSWRNFLILAFSGFFVLGFGLVLLLWAKLFALINIDFFETLFSKDWFIFPVAGFAFGLGTIIFRQLIAVIDSVSRLLQGLIKLLLPMTILLALVFVLALPFTGINALWETGIGTHLLLWLIALILFFTNAVYQDGSGDDPYPRFLHRLVYMGLCVLPILCSLSFYGLMLRWQQYGWTVQRCWAMLIWLVLALFSLGYVWGIVTRRFEWPRILEKVNTGMGLVVLVLMLLSNSPLLNFRSISMDSQLGRVASGDIDLEDLDFRYIHYNLARTGYLALEKIKTENEGLSEELLAQIASPRHQAVMGTQANPEKFWREMHFRPERFELPAALVTLIEQGGPALFMAAGPMQNSGEAVLIKIDLNADEQAEYVLIRLYDRGDGHQEIFQASYYYREENTWRAGSLTYPGGRQTFFSANGAIGMSARRRDFDRDKGSIIKSGEISLQKPRFDNLRIGDIVLQPN